MKLQATMGSGNVFEDLGVDNPARRLAKADEAEGGEATRIAA